MINNRFLISVFVFFVVVAISVMLYKVNCLNFPLTRTQENTLWQIETQIRFKADNDQSQQVQAWLPRNTERFVINDEDFYSGNYGLTIAKSDFGNRAEWTIRSAKGWQTLFHRALIEPVESDLGDMDASTPVVEKPIFNAIEGEVATMVIKHAEKTSADHESLVLQLIATINQRNSMDNLSVLLPAGNSSAMPILIRLLANQNIPARVANGIYLKDDSEGDINSWLHVYDGNQWQLFDIQNEQIISNEEALVIWTGFEKFVTLNGNSNNVDVKLSLSPRNENLLSFFQLRKNEAKHWLIDYSFFSLPLSIQHDFKILVTIPIGVLLLVLLRNLIGIKTFGTFLPILIALSFRETGLISGIILFTLVVGLGLLTRFLLDRLSLLMIPRVGSILIVVLIFMVTIATFSYKLGIDVGLSVTLFPMVILAIMIERMSILWDERGPFEVFKQALGTIMVAALGFWIMNLGALQHILFVFPELLLIVLGITMLMGRYTGFKLTELFRFRALIDSEMTRRA